MLLMIIGILAVLGLCLGSFVNALVWRLHEQETHTGKSKANKQYRERLSVAKGRSMCPACHHELAARDLVPILSWLSLAGKCRYCRKSISVQYPLVEAATAVLFVISYLYWSSAVSGVQVLLLGLWLALLVGLMALLVYDMRWMLLPNRIVYPLGVIAAAYALIVIGIADEPVTALLSTVLSVAVAGGIFYALFQVSGGKWIGGGDVKLGWVIGLLLGTPARGFLYLFLAAILGTVISIPLMASKRLKRSSLIPFGPFLIIAAVVALLFGDRILNWYQHTVLMLY